MIATRRGILLAAAAAAALVLSPGRADGHLADFILAKVTPREGRVEVELTADCSGGAMISSEAEAREVLAKVLRVRVNNGESQELGALAALQFERRTQIDPAAPVPRDPGDEARPHRLLSATWSWGGAKRVSFEVPADAGGQSVILWTPAVRAGEQARWVMLVGGDISPEMAIPRRPVAPIVFGCAGAVVLGAVVFWRLRRGGHGPDNLVAGSSVA